VKSFIRFTSTSLKSMLLILVVNVIVTPLSTIEYTSVDSGVTNLIHDRRSCVDFTLEVEANVARCVHSSVNKPGVKRQQWVMRRLPTADSIVEIGRKSRS